MGIRSFLRALFSGKHSIPPQPQPAIEAEYPDWVKRARDAGPLHYPDGRGVIHPRAVDKQPPAVLRSRPSAPPMRSPYEGRTISNRYDDDTAANMAILYGATGGFSSGADDTCHTPSPSYDNGSSSSSSYDSGGSSGGCD